MCLLCAVSDPDSSEFPQVLDTESPEWTSVCESIDNIQSEISPEWDNLLKNVLKKSPGAFLKPDTLPDKAHGTMTIQLVEGAQPPPAKNLLPVSL